MKPKPNWNPASEPPDDDVLVLLRLDSEAYPIWTGWHAAGQWREVLGGKTDAKVLGWMHLEDAAKKLDL